MMVLEFDPVSGAPHFHGIAISKTAISVAWSFPTYEEMSKLRRNARAALRPFTATEQERYIALQSRLNPNAALRSIWEVLRIELPRHGFGTSRPAQVTPVRSWKTVIGYALKDLKKAAKEFARYGPGTPRVFYSKSFKSRASAAFCWLTEESRLKWRRMSRIAAALRVDPEGCKKLFTRRRWHPRMLVLISELLRRGPSWIELPLEELETRIIQALWSAASVGERFVSSPDLEVSAELGERPRIGTGGPPRPLSGGSTTRAAC
jgi:hypothetical protein